jgi:hypothetical protein
MQKVSPSPSRGRASRRDQPQVSETSQSHVGKTGANRYKSIKRFFFFRFIANEGRSNPWHATAFFRDDVGWAVSSHWARDIVIHAVTMALPITRPRGAALFEIANGREKNSLRPRRGSVYCEKAA